MQACAEKTREPMFVSIATCDESSDCDGGTCCSDAVSGDTLVTVCVAKSGRGDAACDFHEVCAPGGTCRTRGAACAHGVCTKAKPRLRCGATTCAAPGARCCGRPLRCGDASECAALAEQTIGCRSDADCLAGSHCVVTPSESFCSRTIIGGVTVTPCTSDASCRRSAHPVCPGKERCLPTGLDDIRACGCP